MRKVLLIIIILTGYLFCQEYINVGISSGNKQDLISNIQEITFDDSNIIFTLKNGGGTIEAIESITQITFGNTATGDQSLPVELTEFTAVQDDNDVNLFWQTASEMNNQGFDIERKYGNNWEKADFVAGKGNSTSPISYTYRDKNAGRYKNLKYRLKQIDYNGAYEYSPEISIEMETVKLPTQFTLYNNYPNPFNPVTKIYYEIAKENFVTLKIYDMEGREVETLIEQNQQPGRYNLNFNGKNLSSGVYFCRLVSGNQIKIIKMLLVK